MELVTKLLNYKLYVYFMADALHDKYMFSLI